MGNGSGGPGDLSLRPPTRTRWCRRLWATRRTASTWRPPAPLWRRRLTGAAPRRFRWRQGGWRRVLVADDRGGSRRRRSGGERRLYFTAPGVRGRQSGRTDGVVRSGVPRGSSRIPPPGPPIRRPVAEDERASTALQGMDLGDSGLAAAQSRGRSGRGGAGHGGGRSEPRRGLLRRPRLRLDGRPDRGSDRAPR